MCSRLGFPCEHGIPTAEYLYRMRCAFQQAAILLLHSLKSIKAACFHVDDFVHQGIECIEVFDMFTRKYLHVVCKEN